MGCGAERWGGRAAAPYTVPIPGKREKPRFLKTSCAKKKEPVARPQREFGDEHIKGGERGRGRVESGTCSCQETRGGKASKGMFSSKERKEKSRNVDRYAHKSNGGGRRIHLKTELNLGSVRRSSGGKGGTIEPIEARRKKTRGRRSRTRWQWTPRRKRRVECSATTEPSDVTRCMPGGRGKVHVKERRGLTRPRE